jgi:spermidine synthase
MYLTTYTDVHHRSLKKSMQTKYWAVLVPYLIAVLILILVNGYLFRSLARSGNNGRTSNNERRRPWIFSPDAMGQFSYWRLGLVSILGLFLELLMIRWVSSEIRMFAYFKNFVLIACFLGFGVGCYISRRSVNLLQTLLPLLTVVALIKIPYGPLRMLIGRLPSYLGIFSEVSFWSVPSQRISLLSVAGLIAALNIVVLIFMLITFLFVPLGQVVGRYLERSNRGVFAYSVNILGSLVGIALYTLLCFLYQPPAVWLAVAGVMLTILVWKIPTLRYISASVLAVCVALASIGPAGYGSVYWSPYQKLTVTPVRSENEVISYELNTNDDWHQQIFNLSPAFVSEHPAFFRDVSIEWNAYNLPYHFYPDPQSVLVLGAGTGNDVAAALRNGAERVVAVEIDPLILRLGHRLHFERPYDSPRVTTVLDDARSYVQNSTDHFDLILFSLLDSHTTSSHFTNIRIDNYVYTSEALAAAKQRLRPGGIMVVKFWVDSPWIAGRLHDLLTKTFGSPPLQMQAERPFYATTGRFFVSGSSSKLAEALTDQKLAGYVQTHNRVEMQSAALTTDDWPYFYQQRKGLSSTVLLISGALIVLCWIFLRQVGTEEHSFSWHFFFLGAGFLLLEAQIVSKMALLCGTTWAVNAIVIGSLMLIIIASNVVVQQWPLISRNVGFWGIFITIGISYGIPVENLLFQSYAIKVLVSSLILCSPVFFAGIVFIQSFANAGFRSSTLGSNLFGALVGGLLESLSYWTGIRALLLLAAALYLASWIALRKSSLRLAHVEQSNTAGEANPVLLKQD